MIYPPIQQFTPMRDRLHKRVWPLGCPSPTLWLLFHSLEARVGRAVHLRLLHVFEVFIARFM
jgi:hypothetical protein